MLITLVIIGIIAAITVPTLITKYQKEQTVTRLKKAYSALAQTTNRAIADNGSIETWELGQSADAESYMNFINKYLLPYLNVQKICEDTDETCNIEVKYLNKSLGTQQFNGATRKFFLNDGTLIMFNINNDDIHKYARIYIDINGKNKPNQWGKDVFYFIYYLKYTPIPVLEGKFVPVGYPIKARSDLTKETPLNTCNKNNYGWYCAALIMNDGWQIKDDYPW